MSVFTDQYRFDEGYGEFKVATPQKESTGYFRFGSNAICYGRTSAGFLQPTAKDNLYDVARDVIVAGCNTILPFDPNEVINNLRYERYVRSGQERPSVLWTLARRVYYLFRPVMPVSFRKHLQRSYLKDWDQIAFPSWPVDR